MTWIMDSLLKCIIFYIFCFLITVISITFKSYHMKIYWNFHIYSAEKQFYVNNGLFYQKIILLNQNIDYRVVDLIINTPTNNNCYIN